MFGTYVEVMQERKVKVGLCIVTRDFRNFNRPQEDDGTEAKMFSHSFKFCRSLSLKNFVS